MRYFKIAYRSNNRDEKIIEWSESELSNFVSEDGDMIYRFIDDDPLLLSEKIFLESDEEGGVFTELYNRAIKKFMENPMDNWNYYNDDKVCTKKGLELKYEIIE